MGLKGTFLNPLIFIQQHFHTQIAQFNIVADRALIYSNLESGPKEICAAENIHFHHLSDFVLLSC